MVLELTKDQGRIAEEARLIAEKAVASFEGVGIFGVELFLLEDGSIVINEIAPVIFLI